MSNAIPSGPITALALVPEELRRHDRWVCWRRETRDGKPTKVPYNAATGLRASSTDPRDWFPFDAAVGAAGEGGYDGVGFVFAEGEGFCGIDIDGCIGEDGRVSDGAREIIDALGSYAEVSPSGTGVKIFLKGVKPPTAKCKRGGVAGFKAIEIYEHGRYFTVTGRHLEGTPLTVEDRQAALDALCARLWPARPTTPTPPRAAATTAQGGFGAADPDDDRLLDRARKAANGAKFRALYDEGDTSGNAGDDSGADLALCSILMYWTNGDAERVDRLFRGSKLYRPKWERDDYRASTLSVAAQGIAMKTKAASGGRLPPAAPGAVATAPEDGDGAQRPLTFPLTDLGNAERLAAERRDALRYCVTSGRWLEWDGTRWRSDDQGAAHRHAGAVVREMFLDAASSDHVERRTGLANWSVRSEGSQRLDAMVALAATRQELIVRADDLDRDAMAFNCLNGTLDLRTGEVRAPQPSDLITKVARVSYDPVARCPRFAEFLLQVFGGDEELIGFVQRFLGMCLTGDIREQVFVLFNGEGGNGKSVLVDLMLRIMGDYAAMAPSSLVVETGRAEHPTEIADLMGRRFVIASESNEEVNLREDQVKRLTGDSRLKARYMRGDFFEFDRTHKLVALINRLPRVRENSRAVWRRICIVPFAVPIRDEDKDTLLLPTLYLEAAGVLNWLIAGCLRWQEVGLQPPSVVQAATNAYRKREDSVGQFLAERIEYENAPPHEQPQWFTPWRDLKSEYISWCRTWDHRQEPDTALQDALERLGVRSATKRVEGVPTKGRAGISLKKDGLGDGVTALPVLPPPQFPI